MMELTLALQGGAVRWERPDAVASDFRGAAGPAMAQLRALTGLPCFVAAEIVGDEWRVIAADDEVFGLRAGMAAPWSSTLCSRVAAGTAPRVAPDVDDVPVLADAPMARSLRIAAYLGAPMTHDGHLVGAIAGFDVGPRPESLARYIGLVEAFAAALGAVRVHEQHAADVLQRAVRAEVDAMVDPLTQLGTRLAWNQALAEEDARSRRTGRPACVLTVDLDGLKRTNDYYGHEAGDRLLRAAATTLRRTSRLCDHVSRLGGDEFGIVAVECDAAAADALLVRYRAALAAAGIEASVGVAVRGSERGLEGAWHDADAAMYADKRSRRRTRLSRALSGPAGGRPDAASATERTDAATEGPVASTS
jgi:diguanylate cyclase (GGDEF)-like protein